MSVSVSENGVFAFVKSGATPPEIWAGTEKDIKQVTHLNDGAKLAGGKTENIEWTNEGFNVQGWLLYRRSTIRRKNIPFW